MDYIEIYKKSINSLRKKNSKSEKDEILSFSGKKRL